MSGCDAVLHLAAAADVNEVAKMPVESEAANARGTLNVLEAARGAGVRRVVYASTIWVYTGESGESVDEELWARQLGAWVYLPGISGGDSLMSLFAEAGRVVERRGNYQFV